MRTAGRALLRGARMGCGSGRCAGRAPTWPGAAAGSQPSSGAACSRAPGARGLLPLAIFLLGNRGLDVHINLSLHLRSQEPPLEETAAAGTHASRSGGCGCERVREAESRGGRREGGRTEPKTSPPRGSCGPTREHRSVPPPRSRRGRGAARAPERSLSA